MEQVHALFDQAKEYGIFYFGPDQPQRMWYIVMAVCFLACFPGGTRRLGGFGLVGVIMVFAAWNFLSDTFTQTAPPPAPSPSANSRYSRR